MGENFKRKRAESFTHLKDRALREFTMPNLFSARPEIRFASLNCEPRGGGAQEGWDVSVVLATEGAVQVWRGPAVVGVVREPDAATLRDVILVHPDCGGMLTAVVEEHSSMTGDFCIRLTGAVDDGTHD